MLLYRSPAKINLSLDVLSRRADGYHELQSVTHCIGLYDTLSIDLSASPGLSLRCSDASLGGDDNLCLKAARAWQQAAKSLEGKRTYFPGLRLTLDKKIPVGAGLGGGSGNAAATLLALNEYFETPLDEEQLHEVASQLGADVPLFLHGGCSLMEGIGDRMSPLPPLAGWVVLIHPLQHASTPEVYRRFDEMNLPSERKTSALIDAIRGGDFFAAASCLGNDLQAAAQSMGIDTELPIALLKKHGAAGAQMTGSGAASFGLFADEIAAREAMDKLRADAALPQQYRLFSAPLLADGIAQIKAEN